MTLGYVVSRYPLLSETFILREMWALEQQGETLRVYPLRGVGGKRHARAAALRAPVWRAGWLNLGCHARWLRRRPRAYLAALATALWHNRTDGNLWLGALAYWGKAVAIAERMERDRVEQVHAHYATHPALVGWVVQRLTGIPFSFTVHAHDIFCHRAMLGPKLRAANRVIAISRYNQARLAAALSPPERQKVEVIHCGVEWEHFAAQADARLRAPELATTASVPLRLLAVGSLQAYKGHAFLIAACAELAAREVDFACRIVGGGPLRAELERQIGALGLARQVQLTGPATEEEVAAALAWAQIFVMPSVRMPRTGQMEGIPVALMEAMAAGLPVVASRLSGIPELVRDGIEGRLVPERDACALAQALLELRPGEVRRRLGRAGRDRVGREFDLERNVTQLAAGWRAGAARGTGREVAA